MVKLFSYIFSNLLDDKNSLDVTVYETEYDIKFSIKADKKEIKKIIGKDGKIINSIRDYFKAVSKKFNKKVYIIVE
mgnify:CR=1 FL=1